MVVILITYLFLFKYYGTKASYSMVIMLMMGILTIVGLGYMARKSGYVSIFNNPNNEILGKERIETTLIVFIIMITLNILIQLYMICCVNQLPMSL